jgi:dTDP-glucose 4,6-dehydratase
VPNPRNPYSASKYAGELIVKAAHNTFGLPYIITRACNNYGPRQTTDKLIPRVIKCILNNEKIPIYGEGKQIRDWMFVLDTYSAVVKILQSDKINQTYNISANCEISNLELVQKICNLMERGHSLIEHIKDPRPGHDFRYSLNSSKLMNELEWKPKYKLGEGLEQCVSWFLANQWWFK